MQAKLLDVCARARVCSSSSSIGSGGSGRRRDAVVLPHVSMSAVLLMPKADVLSIFGCKLKA